MKKVKVLFIGGEGRSGSTLLDRILGQVPGVASAGEIRNLWNEGALSNHLCSCGNQFRSCEFWGPVGDVAFGGWDQPEVVEAARLGRFLDRLRMTPFLLLPILWPGQRSKLDRYKLLLAQLYGAIHETSHCRVIVDSSKSPATALLVAGLENVDLAVVHLVRDSRGVAFSWLKKVIKPDTGQFMPTYSPVRMSSRWLVTNVLFHGIAYLKMKIPVLFVRYEDLCTDPTSVLHQLLEFIGVDNNDILRSIVDNGNHYGLITFRRSTHIVAGNYNKMAEEIVIRCDEKWKLDMPRGTRRLVSVLTWPLLLRYGYLSDKTRSCGEGPSLPESGIISR